MEWYINAGSFCFVLFISFFVLEITIGGNEGGVIYFDNDYHFCLPRLISIIEKRVRDALTASSQNIFNKMHLNEPLLKRADVENPKS